MDRRAELAAASRDGYQALRRVERHQVLIERLHAARGRRLLFEELADILRVSPRTIARDVEQLRISGVPLTTHQGRRGGVSMAARGRLQPIALDLPEIGALMSSLAVLGPSVTGSAASAMRKLAAALNTNEPGRFDQADP